MEIADALLADARKVSARRGVTLRTLIEEGLRGVVRADAARSTFRLRDASFRGEGLDPAFSAEDWDRLRDGAYKGRGA